MSLVRLLIVAASLPLANSFGCGGLRRTRGLRVPLAHLTATNTVQIRSSSYLVSMKIPIVDDVLDYLTNKGGYTGFTEGQLKSGQPLTEADMSMVNFGKQRETDNTVTTIFVLLLLATPFIVGSAGFSLGVFVVPSFVKF
jgi:hypothetical protein